ncbi:hypothetical protein [Asaia prunellae]|uniref:hypothetical protein n=1 Tax=Asaia prunellae TaxID=610245 RepID=UPI00046FE891|nr:hypothetical protein [Asaia prunellae]
MARTVRPRATTAKKRKTSAAESRSPNELLLQASDEAEPPAEEASTAPIEIPSPSSGEGDENPTEIQTSNESAAQTVKSYPVEALYFDASWYLETYPDVGACGIDAVEHFLTHGYLEGRNPNGHFNVLEYIAANPDIPLTINPFLHFIMHGAAEGRPLRR